MQNKNISCVDLTKEPIKFTIPLQNMKKCHFVKVFFLLFSAWIFFSGCTSTKIIGDSNIEPIYITNIKKLYLLPPFDIEKNIDSEQLLTATFGDNTMAFLAYLKADENEIFLSMFNDFGTGMGTLFYDGVNISFDSPVFPQNLKSEYIVADLQFAYYKVHSIQKLLKSIKMKMVVEKNENSEKRKIYNGPFLIEEITKSEKSIVIKNKLRGYEYVLQEVE